MSETGRGSKGVRGRSGEGGAANHVVLLQVHSAKSCARYFSPWTTSALGYVCNKQLRSRW